MGEGSDWLQRRREAFAAHATALDRQRAAETAQARALLASFVREMLERGLTPTRLRARVPDSRTTYRTNLTGWYLRRNRSLATSVEADLYLLDASRSLRSWLLGVRLRPIDPPLRIGVGARDGESTPLDRLLRQRLEAGHHGPDT
jgi:hypothetical protein